MPSSSERVVEELSWNSEGEYLIYLFHLAAYEFARPIAAGKRVLDFGCGTGYGTRKLASDCQRIIGVDVSAEAVDYATAMYGAANLNFQTVEPSHIEPLPFPDNAFDVVLSFQVIEHIRDVTSYLSETRRVLRSNGSLILATPNRSTRLFPFQKPWNIWHVNEYSEDSLRRLLSLHFGDADIMHMGGDPNIMEIEFARTRKIKWASLPFTLSWLPENVRLSGLRFLKQLQSKTSAKTNRHVVIDFDISSILISHGALPSTNLVAVVKNP